MYYFFGFLEYRKNKNNGKTTSYIKKTLSYLYNFE